MVSAPKFSIQATVQSNPEEPRVTSSGRMSRNFTKDEIFNKQSQQNTRTFHRFHFFDYINCMIVSTLFNTQSERRSVMKTYEKLED